MTGSPAQWMLLFCDWALAPPPLRGLDAAVDQGAAPVLTWEPWHAPPAHDPSAHEVEQPQFSLLRIAAGEHDDNVRWCWAPTIPDGLASASPGSLTDYFPGRPDVDLLGLDGYNWEAAGPNGWVEAPDLFARGLRELRDLDTGLPIVITETASAEGPDDGAAKAAWTTQLFAHLKRQGDVRAVVRFHLDKEVDRRIDSSPRARAAYREAVAALGNHRNT